MNIQTKGRINSIETFGAVDGPGVRYVIFLQGCAMRCKYCHNPETWSLTGGNSYQETPEETFRKAWRYHSYWKNGGGITISGGEALLQIDYVTELFRIAKSHGVHTTLDTSGNPFTRREPFFSKFQELMKVTDLFLLDIKEINPVVHKSLTGWTNENILDMASYLSDQGKAMWIRHVLVPGITDNDADLRGLRAFIDTLDTVERTEILPYHAMGTSKYEKLGIPYPLSNTLSPTQEEILHAKELLVS